MKRYLKIFGVAFLAGVGAARVLIWLNMGIVHLLVMRGGWEAAAAVKAAPWILLALGGGLIFSIAVMLADSKHYEHSAQKQQQTTVKAPTRERQGNMDDLKELRALRDRLLQSIGWYTGKAENGNTEVKTDDVICRLRWVLNGKEPRQGA